MTDTFDPSAGFRSPTSWLRPKKPGDLGLGDDGAPDTAPDPAADAIPPPPPAPTPIPLLPSSRDGPATGEGGNGVSTASSAGDDAGTSTSDAVTPSSQPLPPPSVAPAPPNGPPSVPPFLGPKPPSTPLSPAWKDSLRTSVSPIAINVATSAGVGVKPPMPTGKTGPDYSDPRVQRAIAMGIKPEVIPNPMPVGWPLKQVPIWPGVKFPGNWVRDPYSTDILIIAPDSPAEEKYNALGHYLPGRGPINPPPPGPDGQPSWRTMPPVTKGAMPPPELTRTPAQALGGYGPLPSAGLASAAVNMPYQRPLSARPLSAPLPDGVANGPPTTATAQPVRLIPASDATLGQAAGPPPAGWLPPG